MEPNGPYWKNKKVTSQGERVFGSLPDPMAYNIDRANWQNSYGGYNENIQAWMPHQGGTSYHQRNLSQGDCTELGTLYEELHQERERSIKIEAKVLELETRLLKMQEAMDDLLQKGSLPPFQEEAKTHWEKIWLAFLEEEKDRRDRQENNRMELSMKILEQAATMKTMQSVIDQYVSMVTTTKQNKEEHVEAITCEDDRKNGQVEPNSQMCKVEIVESVDTIMRGGEKEKETMKNLGGTANLTHPPIYEHRDFCSWSCDDEKDFDVVLLEEYTTVIGVNDSVLQEEKILRVDEVDTKDERTKNRKMKKKEKKKKAKIEGKKTKDKLEVLE